MIKIDRLLTEEDFEVQSDSIVTNTGVFKKTRRYITTDFKLKTANESDSGSAYKEYYHGSKEKARKALDLFLKTHMIVDGKLLWSRELVKQLKAP